MLYVVLGPSLRAVALPLDDDDQTFVGSEVVIIPGSGVYDCYTGRSWKNTDEWCESIVKVDWKNWLKEHAPPPPAEPQPPRPIVMLTQ
jgi:hypothetical protein